MPNIIIVNIKLWALLLALCVLFMSFVYWIFPDIDTREHGIVETVQAFFIFISMIMYALSFFSNKEAGDKIVALLLSLLSLSFLLREVDVEKLDICFFFILAGSGIGRNIFLSLLWFIIFLYILKFREVFWNSMKKLLSSSEGQVLMFSALMLIFGELMDKNIFSINSLKIQVFYEELFELVGYIYLSFASFLRYKNRKI